jgi:uncharacterized membrane protein
VRARSTSPNSLPDHYLPFSVPGLGLVIAFVALTTLGALTANLVGTGNSTRPTVRNEVPLVENRVSNTWRRPR